MIGFQSRYKPTYHSSTPASLLNMIQGGKLKYYGHILRTDNSLEN